MEYLVSAAGDTIELEVGVGVVAPSVGSKGLLLAVADGDFVGKRVFDLGCGSGYLGVGLLLRGADFLWGSDSVAAAVACARRTAARNGCAERAVFYRGHFFSAVDGPTPFVPPIDLVIANPPRTPTDLVPPNCALPATIDGGPTGDRLLLEILELSRRHLGADGLLYVPVSSLANPNKVKERAATLYRQCAVVAQWEYPVTGYWLERRDVLERLESIGGACLFERGGRLWGRTEILRCQFPLG